MRYMVSPRSAALATTLVLSACAGTGVIRVERNSLPPAIAEAIRRASDHRDAGEHDASLQVVQLLLERDPWLVPAHRIRQDLERERGREGSLIVEYLELARRHPERPEPCYLMGRLERNLDLQEEWFLRAVETAPGDWWGQFGLAFVARRRGRLEEAETRYRALVDARPEEPLAHTALGEVLRMLRKYPEAERAYRHFQQHSPSDGRADLGLARTFWEGGRRELVLGALVRAVQRRAGDPAVVDLVGQFLETAAAPPERRRIRDLLESHAVRDPFVRAGGAPLLGSLALEEGDLAGLRRHLETDTRPPSSPELFLLWRRARVAEGAVGHAVAEWEKRLPRSLISDQDNRIRGRLIGLLRGPWRKDEDPVATPDASVDVLRALRDAGWLAEAKILANRALLRHAGHPQIEAIADEVGRQLSFESALRRILYSGYQGGSDRRDLASMLEALRDVSRDTLGFDAVGQPRLLRFTLIGSVVDPEGPGLPAHMARYNRYLILGQRDGRAPEGLMLTRLSVRPIPEDRDLPVAPGSLEVVGEERSVRSLSGVTGGDLAGAAFFNHYFVDLDAVRRWAWEIVDRRDRLAPFRTDSLADPIPPADPLSLDRPARVHEKLDLVSPHADEDLLEAVLDMIRWHERAHLVDASRYLPVFANLFPALGLLFSHGFSAASIEAEMEMRAETAALAKSSAPLLVLAHVAGFLGEDDASGPHAMGFRRLAVRIVRRLAEDPPSGIDATRNVVAQWHLLAGERARSLGRTLLAE